MEQQIGAKKMKSAIRNCKYDKTHLSGEMIHVCTSLELA
jgi:hypothetical protein